jgi:pimeloyl-ACP methyl ester carboxylesterase
MYEVLCGAPHVVTAADIPSAIYQDPAPDPAYPAAGQGVQIPSQGQQMNAMVYLPSGRGPHPVIVMMHGLPGDEQNLDLAQVLRRAGWVVVAFHYRGAWGSAGAFSFEGAYADGPAAIAWLEEPQTATALHIDPGHLVVLGHSMGGYIAARTCAEHSELQACILLAPWDPSSTARTIAAMPADARERFARHDFGGIDGRVSGATSKSLTDSLARDGQGWQLAQFAPQLAKRPLLVILATRDGDDDKALDLLAALRSQHATRLSVVILDSDHSFNDHRIALEISVLSWLEGRLNARTPR